MSDQNPSLLSARNLSKTFPGGDGEITALGGVDFELGMGESVSIRGESGSGKSTFLNVLSGLETSDGGSLLWDGVDVAGYSLSKMASLRAGFIGFVFQAYYLAPELNALENVLLGARIHQRITKVIEDRALDLLKRVGMQHRIKHPSTKLSGGERQRVAVARALINDPPLILADEPTGNLDETTGEAVMELLLELTEERQKSLVLVTHNADFAARTLRELTLHLGQFV